MYRPSCLVLWPVIFFLSSRASYFRKQSLFCLLSSQSKNRLFSKITSPRSLERICLLLSKQLVLDNQGQIVKSNSDELGCSCRPNVFLLMVTSPLTSKPMYYLYYIPCASTLISLTRCSNVEQLSYKRDIPKL